MSLARKPPGLLQGTAIIFRRELGATFDSAIAYVTVIGFILLANTLFMNQFFLIGKLDMTPFFDALPALCIVFTPAISMRLWAEERRARTFEMLVTFPMRPLSLVLGKYCAALFLYSLVLAGSLPIVWMLTQLGSPDLGTIAAGYLGALLLGATFIALGEWISALVSDQVVAFVLTALAAGFFVLTGDDNVIAILDGLGPGLGSRFAQTISVLPHYSSFVRGLLDLSSLAYFVAVSLLLLAACAGSVQRNRA